MREVRASAPGKINLTLRAGAPHSDGYHQLVTVFEALDLRETVTVRTCRHPGIHVQTCAYRPDGSPDEASTATMNALDPRTHLAYRAAKTLQRLAMTGPWAHTAAGLEIEVDKHVPVAGGMAGGSADAAATLRACNELWELGLDAQRLELLGRSLGADVPACLVGGIALGTGRGDHMRVLAQTEHAPRHHWAIACSHEGLSTPEVFRALDAQGGPGGSWSALNEPSEAEIAALTGTAHALAPLLINDLQDSAVALRGHLSTTLEEARKAGALGVLVSGSGPTIGALADSAEAACRIAAHLQTLPAVAFALTTSGPAMGAIIENN